MAEAAQAGVVAEVVVEATERRRRMEENRTSDVAREAIATIAMLRSSLKEQAAETRNTLRGEVRQAGAAFKGEMDLAGQALQRRMEAVLDKADRAASAFATAQDALAAQRRKNFWILGIVLALCLASLITTYLCLYGFYQARYDELRAKVSYLDAINRSDVVPCGDGKLCARVDDKAPRYGDKKDYRVVAPRP